MSAWIDGIAMKMKKNEADGEGGLVVEVVEVVEGRRDFKSRVWYTHLMLGKNILG